MTRKIVTDGEQSLEAGEPLHVGLFSPALPESGFANGIVTYVRVMRDALRSIGHSVTIVTPTHIDAAEGGVCALAPSRGLIGRLRSFAESRHGADGSHPWTRLRIIDAFRAARRAGVQVFEIEESFGWAGRLVGRGIPIVERLHGPHVFVRDRFGSEEERRLGDLREAAELKSFIRADVVTAPTQALIDRLTDVYDLSLPFARAIPNPIPVAPPQRRWSAQRADLDQILCVGRFDWCKGADVVVRAFARALERRPSLKLIMVGPDHGIKQENGNVVQFAEFAGIEIPPEACARIRFLGAQSPGQIAELRLRSAFSLIGSRFEVFSYAISEAMAVGMPVLATNTFGGSMLIRDRIDGRISPIGEIEPMAEAMLEMIRDSAQLAEMGASAYARAANLLSPERIADETLAVYRQAIAKTRGE
jgi:glycosyltransferase involved in cell wall biosynthesis